MTTSTPSINLPLRDALKRGALVALANWPVVLVEFAIESLFKLTLAVPVIGGALMVASLIGADLGSVLAEGVRPAADLIIGSLGNAPAALAAFFIAVSLVALGGEIIVYVVKAGTLHVLVTGDARAGDLHRRPIEIESVSRAHAYSLEALLAGSHRFGRRAVRLALMLGGAYFVIGLGYFLLVTLGFGGARGGWIGTAPLVLTLATSAGLVGVTLVNLAYDLVRVIVLTDDCRVRDAFSRLRVFILEDARQVIGIFAVMWGVVLLGTALGLLATAGVTIVASMPFLGLLVIPLQGAAWMVRGLLFQYMNLASLSAYQTQYRRFGAARIARATSPAPVTPPL